MTKLQLIEGDLWDYHRKGFVVAITTGGLVQKDGTCAMPRGCARQAAEKIDSLAYTLGTQIRLHGMHVFDLGNRIVSFPVENSPYERPELAIIEQSCCELVELCNYKQWNKIVVPRPGCGLGGLSWSDVRPLLEKHFDERFIVISASDSPGGNG